MKNAERARARRVPAEEKRRRIFDAAREVIIRRGYDAATMDEIAAEAKVGKGTLYNFFVSKEELFFSLVMDGFERIRELVNAEVERFDDPWDRFEVGWRTLMLAIFPQFNRQWGFVYQLWGVLARDSAARERMFAAWRELYRNREEQIIAAILEGQKKGRFVGSVNPSSISLLLMASFDGLLHRAMFDPERVEPETVLRDVLTLVRQALIPHGAYTEETNPTPGGRPRARTPGRQPRGVKRSRTRDRTAGAQTVSGGTVLPAWGPRPGARKQP